MCNDVVDVVFLSMDDGQFTSIFKTVWVKFPAPKYWNVSVNEPMAPECFLMGAYHIGSCFWSTDGGAVLWTALARVAGEFCTLVWGLLSARVGAISGGAPCGRGPGALSVWLAPKGGFFLALGLGAKPCLCLIGAVGLSLCVHVCVRVCVCMSPFLSGYLWGWDGWYVLSLLFLASVRHFVLLLKYERCHINKIWFDLIWMHR